MRHSTFAQAGTALSATSTGTGNLQSITLPAGTSAFLLSCETTTARVTFDGSDPTATGVYHQVPKDNPPQLFVTIPPAGIIYFCSSAGANSVLKATPFVN